MPRTAKSAVLCETVDERRMIMRAMYLQRNVLAGENEKNAFLAHELG